MITSQRANGTRKTRNSSHFKKVRFDFPDEPEIEWPELTAPEVIAQETVPDIPHVQQDTIPVSPEKTVPTPPHAEPRLREKSTRARQRPKYLDDYVP